MSKRTAAAVASAAAHAKPVSRDESRSKRKRAVRAKTISVRNMRQLDTERGRRDYPEQPGVDYRRPATRGECANGPRPCPYTSCSHHLYLDVDRDNGSLRLNFPDLEPGELAESCALDVADRGGMRLEDIGAAMNITRERVRQLEASARKKAIESGVAPELREHLEREVTRPKVHLRIVRSEGALERRAAMLAAMPGQRFGRLVVVRLASKREENDALVTTWHCQCDCGETKDVKRSNLTAGVTRSCGCLRRRGTDEATHQRYGSPEYRAWANLLAAHRGEVCERWQDSRLFLQDIGPRPTADHSLVRIDAAAPYGPGNARWASLAEQGRKRAGGPPSRLLTVGGVTLPLPAWAERAGLSIDVVRSRLLLGWTPERAVSTPRLTRWSRHPKAAE